jgi:hypothetical protein
MTVENFVIRTEFPDSFGEFIVGFLFADACRALAETLSVGCVDDQKKAASLERLAASVESLAMANAADSSRRKTLTQSLQSPASATARRQHQRS